MHYLRREFNQLIKYAQGLGIKVIFSSKPSSASAEWATDGSTITIYDRDRKSPLALCLDAIHELAHHRAFLNAGRKGDLKTDKILDKESEGLELTEAQRKHIYEMELHDSQFQKDIHHDIGSKIPLWRLQVEIDLDNWIYKHFWLKGEWPLRKDIKLKRSEFRRKARSK